jgi:hypothetical protein
VSAERSHFPPKSFVDIQAPASLLTDSVFLWRSPFVAQDELQNYLFIYYFFFFA